MGLKSTIRYKIIKGRREPLCDYQGNCKNLAFKEVYPDLRKKKSNGAGWSYLCRKHFNQERKRIGKKLVYCDIN